MCLTLLLIVTSVVGRRRGDTAGLQLAAVTNPAAATTTEYVLQPHTARIPEHIPTGEYNLSLL